MDFRRLGTDLLALGLLAVCMFVGLSLFTYDPTDPPARIFYPVPSEPVNLGGPAGAYLSHALRTLFGMGAFFVFALLISTSLRLFSRIHHGDFWGRVIGRSLALIAFCVGLQMLFPGAGDGPIVGRGGFVGAWGMVFFARYFSTPGTLILMSALFLAGLLIANELLWFKAVWTVIAFSFRLVRRSPKKAVAAGEVAEESTVNSEPGVEDVDASDDEETESEDEGDESESEELSDETDEEEAEDEVEEVEAVAPPAPIRVNPPVGALLNRPKTPAKVTTARPRTEDYEFPDLDLLEEPEEFPYELLAQKAQVSAQILERTFKEFGLNVKVVEVDTGPVITQFELELEAGLRLNKVTALADDLAIALRVPAVRVVAPIPGKNTVGVEVPNEKQVMVRLRELIESCQPDIEKKRIPVFLGKDVSGRPLMVDLTKMPHLLIAGRTGTGKSVCLNSLILSMLMTRSPDQVKMLMIDPKMVELSPYKRVPHLMHPVITDMKKAEAVLAWAVDKMEERYDLLARVGVRHLDGYNKLSREEILDRLEIDPDSEDAEQIPDQMPYIVIIADEMADMMMTSGKDVEGHIIRLAQKSRAVGIHLVLATQKPTVDVITGLIKSNLPARISFQVASRTDSRVVLDEMGAERLLGNGDMLYLAPGTSNLNRAQGTYVSDEEVNNIIEFFGHLEPEYSVELAQVTAGGGGLARGGIDALRKRDELYEQAIEIVVREGRGSVSLLQRALGIGYGRGARLIDYMAEDGIVGEYNGSQAREVLYSPEQWEAIKSGASMEEAAV